MSTNHTPNYQLSQWVKSDQVKMDDFNADNAKIDAALGALEKTVSQQGTALSSHTASLAKLGNCQIYTTSYTGSGGQSRSLSFPGYPVSVFIQCANMSISCNFMRGLSYSAELSPQWTSRSLTLNKPGGNAIGYDYPNYNYFVLALLDMSK